MKKGDSSQEIRPPIGDLICAIMKNELSNSSMEEIVALVRWYGFMPANFGVQPRNAFSFKEAPLAFAIITSDKEPCLLHLFQESMTYVILTGEAVPMLKMHDMPDNVETTMSGVMGYQEYIGEIIYNILVKGWGRMRRK